jgi:hypothetical protein
LYIQDLVNVIKLTCNAVGPGSNPATQFTSNLVSGIGQSDQTYNALVSGSNPAPPQPTANYVSP